MKITMIGGGALRVLGIMRGALAIPAVLDGGEIYLYDLNVARAEAMGRMLLKTPEQNRAACHIRWGDHLEEALSGADIVGMILPASRPKSFGLGIAPSLDRGFISSDNVSPNGAVSAVKIAPVVMNIARKMEIHCPKAWLINFVNPVAVLSGMVNNHTTIRALGVCQGFINHLWDIPRLFGKDEQAERLEVECAGINHLSYVMKGTWNDDDLFDALNRRMSGEWQMCDLQPWWSDAMRSNIRGSIIKLARIWKELDVLIFSTEGDGMAHLMYQEAVTESRANHRECSEAELDESLQKKWEGRLAADCQFQAMLSQDLDQAFWENHWQKDLTFKRQDEDIFVRIFGALAGVKEARIATSRLNEGAIAGIKHRHVVEYSQVLFKDQIRPASDRPYEIPDVVHGLSASLAAHQTLLGDALATEDPRQLAHALLSYPVKPYSQDARSLYKDLLKIAGTEIKPEYAKAADYL